MHLGGTQCQQQAVDEGDADSVMDRLDSGSIASRQELCGQQQPCKPAEFERTVSKLIKSTIRVL